MSEPVRLTGRWLHDHPLPGVGAGLDKEGRGLALIAGGSRFVPGALRLTAEAALRAGAGKVRIATVEALAAPLGVLVPEAGMIALPGTEEGEIDCAAADRLVAQAGRCDALVLGGGMRDTDDLPPLIGRLVEALGPGASALFDAGALAALKACPDAGRPLDGRLVLTPHHGELSTLTGASAEAIDRDPAEHALRAAQRFGAVVALKSDETFIAAPDGTLLLYSSDAAGLGTAGSGDVLAGIVGGLLARGAPALVATAWGVWLHGEAGKMAAAGIGPLGFLARELGAFVPALMGSQSGRS
ncbi:NAD(P)H-hydrate dehydratase [Sphingomonas aracearum]|uniref:ADP-dependent (S)-NAD(P)H-hydrate dehydratase n=1 Tax=Sphingomonas aracearum TaxID=2283317 RepID=A0A369VXY5_9SPHN|nr:NAD(P)H-hydrate dehydratase [Sphingomonas aracearum]RDE07246.1 NAD(P)H-hydrate dehydratase [Sphingomonas aracearum]